MTQYQSNFNAYAAFKAQSALGTQATGAGGIILRQTGGTPGKLTKTPIESKEVRRDAQKTIGRHGMQATTAGPYTCEVSQGSFDPLYQALLRGTWDSEITANAGDFTSTTFGANTIVWASGNPITKGFRVNDVIEITASATPANNSRNIRIAGLSATTITTVETLTTAGGGDTSTVIKRRGRKVIMPAAGSLVNTFFTIDEYEFDLDSSRVFTDCFGKSGKWTMTPNGLLTFDVDFVGTGKFDILTGSGAPLLTTPTLPSSTPLAVLDATLRIGGVDVGDLTSFDLTIDTAPVAPAVAGSKISPTVLPGQNQVSMNLKFLRKDTSWDADFLNETSLSLQVLAVPNMAEPKDFLALTVPFFTLSSADVSALTTAGGARDVTIQVPAALVGIDTTGAANDATMMSIQISNNS
jgi:hypothetical protein